MLYEKIQAEIKESMKSKDNNKKDVLKQVQIKVQAHAKESKVEITDEVVLDALRKELKQLNQTKASLAGHENSELYISTEKKIAILNTYLPKQMTKEECLAAVKRLLSKVPEDTKTGVVFGMIMKELKGKADNRLIKECIEECIR